MNTKNRLAVSALVALLLVGLVSGQNVTNQLEHQTYRYRNGTIFTLDPSFRLADEDGAWSYTQAQIANVLAGGGVNYGAITNALGYTPATNGAPFTGTAPGYFLIPDAATNYTIQGFGTNGSVLARMLISSTNAFTGSGLNLDFNLGNYQYVTTNNDVPISGFIGMMSTGMVWTVLSYSNSDTVAHNFTWPTACRLYGTNTGTSISVGAAKVLKGTFSAGPHGTNLCAAVSNN